MKIFLIKKEMIKGKTFLDFSSQSLLDHDVEKLCRILYENKTVENLLLNNNFITDKGAEHVINLLEKNFTIHRLELACNNLSDGMVLNLKKRFSSRFDKNESIFNKLTLDQHPKRREIDCLKKISKELFLNYYVKNQVPFLIKNGVDRASELMSWTPDFLRKRYGQSPINLKFINYRTYPRSNVKLKTTIRGALDYIENNIDNDVKLYSEASPILNENPILREKVTLPDWANIADESPPMHLWLGQRDTMSGFHYDRGSTVGNIFMQIYGRKFIRLFHASESRFFSQYPEKPFRLTPRKCDNRVSASQIANIDNVNPSFKNRFNFSSAPWIIVLEPGDILYMPAYFWHDVRSLGTSISVNCWLEPNNDLANSKPSQTSLESNLDAILIARLHESTISEIAQDIDVFLKKGGDPNYTSEVLANTSILHMGVTYNLKEVVGLLLNHKDIQPNRIKHGYPYSPFQLAIEFGFSEIVNLFLNSNLIDPNEHFISTGDSPITLAVQKNNLSVLKILLEHNAIFPKKIDLNGKTAIELSLKNKDLSCALMLLSANSGIYLEDFKIFFEGKDAIKEKLAGMIS